MEHTNHVPDLWHSIKFEYKVGTGTIVSKLEFKAFFCDTLFTPHSHDNLRQLHLVIRSTGTLHNM